MRIKANLYSGRLFEYWEPKGATIRSYLEGGKDSSKMHTDGRINLELAVRIATSALGRHPASLRDHLTVKAVSHGSVR